MQDVAIDEGELARRNAQDVRAGRYLLGEVLRELRRQRSAGEALHPADAQLLT
jgi:hypothetical protein